MTYLSKDLKGDLSDRPITVLVVDDEEGIRQSIRMILKDRCIVLTARDEAEAMHHLTTANVDVDIVALDIRLGEKSGIDFLQRIKQMAPDVEVFLITGYPSMDTAIHAMRCGAYDYVMKPFNRNVVWEVVRKGILRQGQSLFEKRMQIRNNRPRPTP